MLRAGFRDPDEFRRMTYIAALMRCFPGRNRQNTGDLPPPPADQAAIVAANKRGAVPASQ